MKFKQLVAALALAAFVGAAYSTPAAQASVIYTGNHVTFSNVQQSVAGPAGAPADPFGTPVVSGNSLVFTPSAFNAQAAQPGPGLSFIDGTLTMDIRANSGDFLPDVTISEFGDYSLTGTGTAGTFVNVAAPIFVQIIGIDGQGVNPILLKASPLFTGANGGTAGGSGAPGFNLADNGGQGVDWSGSAKIDFAAALAQRNITGHVTRVLLSLDNSLLAVDEAGSNASIAKKGFTVSVAPEPGTLALIGLGLGLLVIRRRKTGRAA